MTDLLLSTPEELRAVVPSHLYRNLDTVRGYLVDSQNTFLRHRLGQPLIVAMLKHYTDIKPIIPDPTDTDTANYDRIESDPWAKLIQLAQRCIAYDALYRSAGIRRVSDNDMGINVAESDNFASVDKDRFSEYKIDLYRGSHSASDMLLTQLQDWEASPDAGAVYDTSSEGEAPASPTDSPATDLSSEAAAIAEILTLWRQSPTYPLTDGLLFTTATEFNQYVNIQQSLDKFVELLPDIRYCQELHLESEIGTDLLAYFQQGHRAATLPPSGEKAYQKLQRTLSLYVEARSPMFKRPDARDEAAGYMRLTTTFIRAHQLDFDRRAMSTSPLFSPHLWPRFDQDGTPLLPDGTPAPEPEGAEAPTEAVHGRAPQAPQPPFRGCSPAAHHPNFINGIEHDHTHGYPCHPPYDDPDRSGFLTTTMV